jgi:hypothetical protein
MKADVHHHIGGLEIKSLEDLKGWDVHHHIGDY